VISVSFMSEPDTRYPMFASTSAMPHIPIPPMPTKWILVSGLRNICPVNALIARTMPLIVALFACGKSKAQCKTDVDELMAFFHAMDHSMPLYWGDDVKLVERPDLPKKTPAEAPVVLVAKTVRMNGVEIAVDTLTERLSASREKIQQNIAMGKVSRSHPPDANEIVLVIDASASWDKVAQVAQAAAAAGFTHPAIAFGLPVTTKPPPRVPVDDKLDELKKMDASGNKATELANLMSKIVKNCKPLQKAFGSVASDEGVDKAQLLIEEMGPALLACNCDVDIPALRNVFYAVANNPHPATVIHLDLTKGGKPIALPAATMWSEAQKQLADGAAVWLSAT